MGVLHGVGNASLDMTLPVARLPLPGETLIATGPVLRAAGGKGLNQAVMAARMGARTRFLAPVGAGEAPEISAALAGEGIAARLAGKDVPTDVSVLLVAGDGENAIVSTGACAEALTPEEVGEFLSPVAAGDFVLLQGNLTLAATQAAMGVATGGGARVVLNLAPVRWALPALPAGSVLVVNAVEARQLTGLGAEDAARALAASGSEAVVTLGAAGVVSCAGGVLAHRKAVAVPVVDTTGAGDVFCGALAAGLLEGMGLGAAIDLAQVLAAMAVGRAGCLGSFPTRDEVLSARAAA